MLVEGCDGGTEEPAGEPAGDAAAAAIRQTPGVDETEQESDTVADQSAAVALAPRFAPIMCKSPPYVFIYTENANTADRRKLRTKLGTYRHELVVDYPTPTRVVFRELGGNQRGVDITVAPPSLPAGDVWAHLAIDATDCQITGGNVVVLKDGTTEVPGSTYDPMWERVTVPIRGNSTYVLAAGEEAAGDSIQ